MSGHDARAWLGRGAAVAVVLALGLWRLDCPGLYYDEVLFVNGWVPGAPCAWCVDGTPLMLLSYLGALKSWLYWPVADALSPALVRAPAVLATAVSLLVAATVAARVAGRGAALVTAALLACDPAFLVLQRIDWGPVAVGVLVRTAALLLLLDWRTRGRTWRLALAGLVVGIALWEKIIFAWTVAAYAAALLATWRWWPRPRVGALAAAALAACVGAAPLLAYNAVQPLATVRQNQIVTAEPLGAVLGARLDRIAGTLAGAHVYEIVMQAPLRVRLPCPQLTPGVAGVACARWPFARGAWMPWALGVALVLALAVPACRRDPGCRFLAVATLGTAAFLVPVALATGPHHVAALLPFPALVVAVVATRLHQAWPRARRGLALVLLLVAATGAVTSVRTAIAFAGLCGRGAWSPSIYEAAAFARAHAGDRLLVGDWGFACPLHALAPGVALEDVSWDLRDGTAEPALLAPRPDRRTFLFLHVPEQTLFPEARRAALALAADAGARLVRVHALADRDGRPNAEILEVLPASERPGA